MRCVKNRELRIPYFSLRIVKGFRCTEYSTAQWASLYGGPCTPRRIAYRQPMALHAQTSPRELFPSRNLKSPKMANSGTRIEPADERSPKGADGCSAHRNGGFRAGISTE